MTRDEWRERLLDVLLEENLSGRPALDVSAAVLRRVESGRRWRGRVRWMAAAAVLLLVVTGLLVNQSTLPDGVAELSGDAWIEAGSLREGTARVVAGAEGASLRLDRATVELGPETVVIMRPAEGRREIVVESGAVECRVQPGSGQFRLTTELGSVQVVGTRFLVKMEEDEMGLRQMVVQVVTGAVLVTALQGGTQMLSAGERGAFGGRRAMDMGIFDAGGRFQNEQEEEEALEVVVARQRLAELKEDAMEDARVVAAYQAVVAAARAVEDARKNSVILQGMEKEIAGLQEQQQKLERPEGGRNRDRWREWHEQFRDLQRQVRQVQFAMLDAVDNDPELARLQKAEQEAQEALLKAYQQVLAEQPQYETLVAEYELLLQQMQARQQRSMLRQQREAERQREERRQEAAEEAAPAPAPEQPAEAPAPAEAKDNGTF